jgi:hypothetical protein
MEKIVRASKYFLKTGSKIYSIQIQIKNLVLMDIMISFLRDFIDQNGIGHTLQETFFLDSAFMASGFGSILRRNSQ